MVGRRRVALTTLTWQPVFFPAFVAVVGAALLAERGTRLRALGGVALGGALTDSRDGGVLRRSSGRSPSSGTASC